MHGLHDIYFIYFDSGSCSIYLCIYRKSQYKVEIDTSSQSSLCSVKFLVPKVTCFDLHCEEQFVQRRRILIILRSGYF